MTTLEHVRAADLIVDPNIRTETALDQHFLASVRERGVLTPITAYRAEDGIHVVFGQRRTLAAQQVNPDSPVPVLLADVAPAQADRLVDQWVENEHRTPLSNSERVNAVEQMTLAGLSDAQIARRTATPKAVVQAARTVATSPTREYADQLTLDQAAALTEFGDDPDHVALLLAAADRGQFDHQAARLRQDRAEAAEMTTATTELAATGVTVITQPRWGEVATLPLSDLTDDPSPSWHSPTLTAEEHAACPGHVAWVAAGHATVIRNPDGQIITEDQAEALAEAIPEADDWSELGISQSWERVLRTEYGCREWNEHHRSRRATNTQPAKTADLTDEQREQARARRRHVIESNKAWKAAAEVRRAWLSEFVTRKTAPKGAEQYVAASIAGNWTNRTDLATEALVLAGFTGTTDDQPSWNGVYELRRAAENAAEAALSPKHALQVAVRIVIGAWEASTTTDTWRHHTVDTPITLRALASWGYTLSDIEQRVVDGTAAEPAVPPTTDSISSTGQK